MATKPSLASTGHSVRTAADALLEACSGARPILFHEPDPRPPARRGRPAKRH
jgi:hypothetical protein